MDLEVGMEEEGGNRAGMGDNRRNESVVKSQKSD